MRAELPQCAAMQRAMIEDQPALSSAVTVAMPFGSACFGPGDAAQAI